MVTVQNLLLCMTTYWCLKSILTKTVYSDKLFYILVYGGI